MGFLYVLVFIIFSIKIENGMSKHFTSRISSQPILKIENGNLRGTQNLTVDLNKPYYAFRGIPYAKPPVGNLRFEPPEPAQPWNNTLDATYDRSQCVQFDMSGSEDCLYINVYTPNLPKQNFSLLPVMVYIYGGTFYNGNSSYLNFGPDYFLDQDIVFVSFNYRVGIFGFGSTGDLVMPGNNGLKDQLLALKWINENIAEFGGNNKKITIFGESAGAVSVSYHLQSKKSQGLFHGAIMESGTSLCLWGLNRLARSFIFKIGAYLSVNTSTSQSLKDGLKTIDYEQVAAVAEIMYAQFAIFNNPKNGLFIGPVSEPEHEGAFFSGKSYEKLSKGEYHRVPTIIGTNSMEANVDITLPIRIYLIKYGLDVTKLLPIDMNIKSKTEQLKVGSTIKLQYYGLTPIILASTEKTAQFISDDQFIRPIRQTALQLSKYSLVFYYSFTYEGLLGGINNRPVSGTRHAEELNYLFRQYRNSTKQDRIVRERMVKLWTNFAKFGNPTPIEDPVLENVTWTPVESNVNHLQYLKIGKSLEMNLNLEAKNMTFWDNLYSQNGHPPYDTY